MKKEPKNGKEIPIKGTITGWYTSTLSWSRELQTPRKEDLVLVFDENGEYTVGVLNTYWIDGGVSVRSVSANTTWLSRKEF